MIEQSRMIELQIIKILWALDLLSITLFILDCSFTWEEEQLNIKKWNAFEWKWHEMNRNERTCNEMQRAKSKVLHRIDSNWPAITFDLQSFPCSMQYLSFPSFQLCSFPFMSLHFISCQMHSSSLVYICSSVQMIEKSRMID